MGYIEGLVKLLAPIAPHMMEEIWQVLGHDHTLTYEPWPTYEAKYLMADTVEVVVQVNGKVRAKLNVDRDMASDKLQALALADAHVKSFLENKEVKKVIAIPNKIVNIVAK